LTDAEFRGLEPVDIWAAMCAAAGKVYGPGGAAEVLGLATGLEPATPR
jgi:hypothetical protein